VDNVVFHVTFFYSRYIVTLGWCVEFMPKIDLDPFPEKNRSKIELRDQSIISAYQPWAQGLNV
jgi:hypothetical protein